jgi:Rieske Fe-S protein
MSESGHPSRRAFVQRAGLAVIALTACGGGSTEPPAPIDGVTISGNVVTIELDRVAGLAPVGGHLFIPAARVVVLHPAADTFRAFSATCTHQGCVVNSFVSNQIRCPCHGSVYDVNGQVVAGPAPRALPSYGATFDAAANTVRVTKS